MLEMVSMLQFAIAKKIQAKMLESGFCGWSPSTLKMNNYLFNLLASLLPDHLKRGYVSKLFVERFYSTIISCIHHAFADDASGWILDFYDIYYCVQCLTLFSDCCLLHNCMHNISYYIPICSTLCIHVILGLKWKVVNLSIVRTW